MNAPLPGRARTPVVGLALLFYLPMLLALFFVRAPGGLIVADWGALALGLALAAVGGAAVIAASHRVSRHTAWGRALHQTLRQALGGLSSRQILWLALLSAGGEEALFRGVLHGRLGLWPTALLFAALHAPFRRTLLPWTVFAFVMGVALGGLTDLAGSLWPAIVLHFLINYFNLHDLAADEESAAGTQDAGDDDLAP